VLSFDLSKAIPPRAYLYLSAFMPGLFLEFSILLANPALACELALRSQEGFGFGRYLTLFVGLFLAYVIGNTLMLFGGWGTGNTGLEGLRPGKRWFTEISNFIVVRKRQPRLSITHKFSSHDEA